MITAAFVRHMARYNRWQNRLIYDLADEVGEAARREDCAMCFGTIHNTLSHQLWDDRMIMTCLAGWPPAEVKTVRTSVGLYDDWADLRLEHAASDERLIAWADGLTDDRLGGTVLWRSAAAEQAGEKPVSLVVMQMFNHQTHHRGQLHVMLSQKGAKTVHTDVAYMPEQDEAA